MGQLEGYALENAIDDFMIALGRLYLEYFQFHLEEAKICAIDYQELLPKLIKPINHEYVYNKWENLVNADEWDEPWERACWVRTNIEAFHEIFGDKAGKLDYGEIVKYMDSLKGSVSFALFQEDTPKNPPKSHWWWFADYDTSEGFFP